MCTSQHCIIRTSALSGRGVWTEVLLLLSDVCVVSSPQVPLPSAFQSLSRSQCVMKSRNYRLDLVFKYIFYQFSNIYLPQLCEDHNSSYRFLGLFGSTSPSTAGSYLIRFPDWHDLTRSYLTILFWQEVRTLGADYCWEPGKGFYIHLFFHCKVSISSRITRFLFCQRDNKISMSFALIYVRGDLDLEFSLKIYQKETVTDKCGPSLSIEMPKRISLGFS